MVRLTKKRGGSLLYNMNETVDLTGNDDIFSGASDAYCAAYICLFVKSEVSGYSPAKDDAKKGQRRIAMKMDNTRNNIRNDMYHSEYIRYR